MAKGLRLGEGCDVTLIQILAFHHMQISSCSLSGTASSSTTTPTKRASTTSTSTITPTKTTSASTTTKSTTTSSTSKTPLTATSTTTLTLTISTTQKTTTSATSTTSTNSTTSTTPTTTTTSNMSTTLSITLSTTSSTSTTLKTLSTTSTIPSMITSTTTSTSSTTTSTSTSPPMTSTTSLQKTTSTSSSTTSSTSLSTTTSTSSSTTSPRTTQTPKDVCDPNHCMNNATCIPVGTANTSYGCICKPGYTDKDCSTEIDECTSTPCKNKGICTDELNAFSCNCTKGFFGETCADDINECASMPCVNNGTCLNEIGKFECVCPLHYTGVRCETDLCNPNPCQHGGLCDYSNTTNDYNCECIEIYAGKSCEKKVDNCLSGPCANSGTCIPGVAWACECQSGWEGGTCSQEIDECASNPCQNSGNCTDQFNAFTCSCIASFSGILCDDHLTTCVIQTTEEKNQRVAMVTAQSLSSISLIICLAILLIIFILLLQHSTERILHMGEEISLLLAQLIILFARTPTIADAAAFCDAQASGNPVKLNQDLCRIVATILHYLFMVHFAFLFLESLNNYCVNTFVANGEPLYGRMKNVLLGIGVPIIPVAATAIFHFNTYISDHTCWCIMDEVNFIAEIVPAVLMCVPALVMNEAAGMGYYNEHPDSIKEKRNGAYSSSRGAMVVIPLSFCAWLVGMTAVHETNLSLYSTCSIMNLILGIAIVIAHTLGNDRVRHLLHQLFCWWSCSKEKPSTPETATAIENSSPKNNDDLN